MSFCSACGARHEDQARFCASCGASLRASTGEPAPVLAGAAAADLEQLIDRRAQAILANERAAEAERARRQEEQESLSLAHLEARTRHEENLSEPRTALGSIARSMRKVALGALMFGLFPGTGMMVHMFLFPALGVSPAAPVCPLVCEGCSPSARTFFQNFEGSWQEKNGRMGYAFVCKNPEIDISRLGVDDVEEDPLNTRLQPYMLNSFAVWMVETAICVPFVTLLLGPIFGLRRRAKRLAERAQTEAELARADAALHAVHVRGRRFPDQA